MIEQNETHMQRTRINLNINKLISGGEIPLHIYTQNNDLEEMLSLEPNLVTNDILSKYRTHRLRLKSPVGKELAHRLIIYYSLNMTDKKDILCESIANATIPRWKRIVEKAYIGFEILTLNMIALGPAVDKYIDHLHKKLNREKVNSLKNYLELT